MNDSFSPELPIDPPEVSLGDTLEDRKHFHNLEAEIFSDRPQCEHCDGLLQIISDPAIGIEYACNNPQCPGNNY